MSPPRSPRVLAPLAAAWLLIAAAATLPFTRALRAGFVSDDYYALAQYSQASADVSPIRFMADAVLTMARVPTRFYRPLAFATVWAEARAWGPRAAPFHLTNLLLHATVCLLAFALLRAIPGARRVDGATTETDQESETITATATAAAMAATMLFAVYPRRVEPVVWIACRPDLLAAALALAAALVYVRGVRRDRAALTGGAALLWLGSLLSKESAALLPLAAIALPRPAGRARRAAVLAFSAAFAGYLALRRTALGAWVGGYGESALRPSPPDLARTVRHAAYLLWPPVEAADDSVRAMRAAGAAAIVLLATVGWLAWRARREPLVRAGLVWIAATILPVAALPVSLATTFNDRLLYLPGFGMACLLAGVAAHARPQPRTLLLATSPLVILFGLWSAMLTSHWETAGSRSHALVEQLAAAIKLRAGTDVSGTLYLAAVPDSYHGAYMLRTAIPEALRVAGGLDRVPAIVSLSTYFVWNPDRATIAASRPDGTTVQLAACDDRPALLTDLATPPADAARDRYGRVAAARAHVPAGAEVFDLAPNAVRALTPGSTQACAPAP